MKTPSVSRNYLVAGIGMLLLSSLLDNLRGPLIPLISKQLNLSYAQSSMFIVLGNATSIFSVFLLLFILNLISEKSLTILVCVLTIASCAFSLLVDDFLTFAVFAVGLGLGMSVLGSLCSIFAIRGSKPENQSRSLAFLHMMYGLSSFAASGIVGIATANKVPWPWLFLLLIPFFFFLIYFLRFRLPDATEHPTHHASQRQSKRLYGAQILVVMVYCTYVGGEVLSSTWLPSYLVGTRGFKVADAAEYVAGFFLVMTISRLLCFAFYKQKYEALILRLSLLLPCVFLGLGYLGFNWAFCFVGVVGPFYPLFLGRASRRFPQNWRSLVLWVVVCNQTALCLLNLFFGKVADMAGVGVAFFIPPFCLLFASALLALYFRDESKSQNTLVS